jgi:hypothetical protein
MGTWSGTFTNEIVTSTPYQAKNGVRAAIDLGALGDTTVNAPVNPSEHSSFSVWFVNPNRNVLTVMATAIQQVIDSAIGENFTSRLHNGLLGWTFIDDEWHLDAFNTATIPLAISFAVQWTPRSTNGSCTIIDSMNVLDVVRTATGRYTITVENITLTLLMLLLPQPFVIGLPAATNASLEVLSQSETTIDIETGYRDKVGNWTEHDLDQDPSNKLMMIGNSIP